MNGWFLVLMSWNIALTVLMGLSWLGLRRVLAGTSLKSLASLTVEVADLQSGFEQLRDGHQRLNSRVGMRELRSRRKGETHDEVPPVNGAVQEELSSPDKPREVKLAGIRAEARRRGLM